MFLFVLFFTNVYLKNVIVSVYENSISFDISYKFQSNIWYANTQYIFNNKIYNTSHLTYFN